MKDHSTKRVDGPLNISTILVELAGWVFFNRKNKYTGHSPNVTISHVNTPNDHLSKQRK